MEGEEGNVHDNDGGDGYRNRDSGGGGDGEGTRFGAFRYPAHQHEHQHEDELEDEEGDLGESDVDMERDMRGMDSPGYEPDAESMIGSPTAEFSEHTMSMSMMPGSPPMSSISVPDSPTAPPRSYFAHQQAQAQAQLQLQTHQYQHQHMPEDAHPQPVHHTSSHTAVSRPSVGSRSGGRSDDTVWERPHVDSEAVDVLHHRQLFRRREDREIRDTREPRDTRDIRDPPLTPSSSTHYYAGAGPSTSSRALIQMPEPSGSRPPSVRQKRTGASAATSDRKSVV